MVEKAEKKLAEQPTAEPKTTVRWDTSGLKSSYANVCNATCTREEVVLNFGVNEAWERTPLEMDIHLFHRIILSPFAAKRIVELLNKLMTDYESRYGALKL
jgi:hypothetical protein